MLGSPYFIEFSANKNLFDPELTLVYIQPYPLPRRLDVRQPTTYVSLLCRLSSPLFEFMATHRLRVPSLVDYRRHSSSSWPPIAYAFLHLSTIVATLRVHGHPSLTRSFTCRLSSPLFEFMATHRLRVPSLVDYRRHSSSSWPPIAYAFLHLSTIVATLRVHGHPSLTRSFTCRLSSPLFEFVATHRLRVPSLVDYRRHSSSSWPPIAYAFLHLSTIVATLRVHGHPSLTRSFTCRLSSPLFEFMATHRLRVPSLVDYRRHSSSSWPPIAYAFLHLSTIVATLRVRGHPSLTRSFTCRLSSPLFEFVATHRLRVPSLVDYRRHSSSSWPPIAYAFLYLSTIVATLRVHGHPSLTRSLTCRLSSPLFEFVATHRLRVPSLVDYRRHSSSSFSPPQDPLLLGFLNTKFSLESTDSIFLNKIEQKCNMVYTEYSVFYQVIQ